MLSILVKNKFINCFEIILGVLCLIYYFTCEVVEANGVSILFIWIVFGTILVIKGIIGLFMSPNMILNILFITFDVLFILFFISIIFFSAFVIKDMNDIAESDCDYIIVLGATVDGSEPSEVLQNRINAAYNYLINNENTKVIGTGGQGADEDISEGMCIGNTLNKMGISSDRILFEDRSRTTVENFKFALDMIEGNPKKIAIATSGFHIFRSKFILSNYIDAEVYGVPSAGGGALIPHYILREYIVFIIDLVLGNYSL